MPSYESPGTANLRADAHVYRGKLTDSPSSGGKDMGGTENLRAATQTKRAEGKSTPGGSADKRPAGVQNFSGMARD